MVSIIVPCYNGEKFIKRCFGSILNQSYKQIEVILVNDGSTDKSEEIIFEYKNKFLEQGMKFNYIYKDNGGLGSAINEGLKHVNGEYLTLLDIDDYIMPDSIKLKVEFLDSNRDYNVVRTNGYYVTEKNLDKKDNLFVVNETEKNNIYIFDDLINAKTNNWAGSYMVRTDKLFDFYKDRNIYESRYGQNLQILLPLVYKSKSGFIDKPLMKYIRQENSLSSSTSTNSFEKQIENMLGYKQIRKYMIDLIVDESEKNTYLRLIDINYARYIMDLSYANRDKQRIYENYNILKNLGCVNLEDKILYYGAKNKLIQFVLRIYRKLFVRR
ncbi:Glycosyl transferase family 2 [Intestinibacter bartlettii DSM 16795]|uniref:glycosyltransferase family A protein n=1 Tax=Intestinibacter bartlettii TaxID=261299 RepID=UPI000163126B|nr:glycosyltransferase family 2 protein [Intestinibacter bartlettii]EDQ95613.1 glycosyltransferase, group 2 family protein [Intestinibacter bartlettii DSM 16795]UWO80606.1 glycosyltransferase family 2 protein [Intestinibacter bartlettii]SKA58623.1 Glycosyl transferase family 2 [Intestinibacter bartlettii DSM 16795]